MYILELPGSPKPHGENEPVEWRVENKYYTASILLHRHHWSEEWSDERAACEAVVVMCNLALVQHIDQLIYLATPINFHSRQMGCRE